MRGCRTSVRTRRHDGPPGTSAQRIGDFWSAAMDTAHIAQLGMYAARARVRAHRRDPSLSDVSAVVAHDQYIGASPLYGLALYQDEKHSDRYAVHLFQGGLGLPDRDYYFNPDERREDAQREYVDHIGRMFRAARRRSVLREGATRR